MLAQYVDDLRFCRHIAETCRYLRDELAGLNSDLLMRIEALDDKFNNLADGFAAHALKLQKLDVLEKGFGGIEFLFGVPGCIGGSVAMNAGSHGLSVDVILEAVSVLDAAGNLKILKKSEIPFSYRSSGLKDVLIVEASFILPRKNPSAKSSPCPPWWNPPPR